MHAWMAMVRRKGKRVERIRDVRLTGGARSLGRARALF